MEIEKQIGNVTVVIEGIATSELVKVGSYEDESEYDTYWITEPYIVDAFDQDFNDVAFTNQQEKEIIDGLDINEFVIWKQQEENLNALG